MEAPVDAIIGHDMSSGIGKAEDLLRRVGDRSIGRKNGPSLVWTTCLTGRWR